jgi:hypothetical protein
MSDVTLQLDVVDPQEGPWEVAGMGVLGAVMVEVEQPEGPAGHPVCRVSGSEAALLVWLLREYVGAVEGALGQALELLQPAQGGNGGARVAG